MIINLIFNNRLSFHLYRFTSSLAPSTSLGHQLVTCSSNIPTCSPSKARTRTPKSCVHWRIPPLPTSLCHPFPFLIGATTHLRPWPAASKTASQPFWAASKWSPSSKTATTIQRHHPTIIMVLISNTCSPSITEEKSHVTYSTVDYFPPPICFEPQINQPDPWPIHRWKWSSSSTPVWEDTMVFLSAASRQRVVDGG